MISDIKTYIENNLNKKSFYELALYFEKENGLLKGQKDTGSYFTTEHIIKNMISKLDFSKNEITLLEPSGGCGNFVYTLLKNYPEKKFTIYFNDIDKNSTDIAKIFFDYYFPKITIIYSNEDYITTTLFDTINFDIILGNPPYLKLSKQPKLLKSYKEKMNNKKTNNLFSFFIEKSLSLNYSQLSFIVPKSLIFVPEFNDTKTLLLKEMIQITDYKKYAFKGVNLETVSFVMNKNSNFDKIEIEDFKLKENFKKEKSYITELGNIWVLYRNDFFDTFIKNKEFGHFKSFRDRKLKNSYLVDKNDFIANKKYIPILRGRNLDKNKIIHIDGYDKFIDKENLENFKQLKSFLNRDCVLMPNLTDKIRFCKLPKNSLFNGACAAIELNNNETISEKDVELLNSDNFKLYWKIVKNNSDLTINIDKNIDYFLLKNK